MMELRRSVPAGIAEIISERILAGQLAPDDRLREEELAAEFEASRNTVREALLLLEHAGLAVRSAHRGSRVARADRAEVVAVMRLRRVIEPGAVRVLIREKVDMRRLRPLVTAMEQAARAHEWDAYVAMDLEFHAALVGAAGGDRLAAEFGRALQPLRLHLAASDRRAPVGGARPHVQEHRQLVELISKGQGAAALRLIDSHLEAAEAALFG